jgi:hypothetical protein
MAQYYLQDISGSTCLRLGNESMPKQTGTIPSEAAVQMAYVQVGASTFACSDAQTNCAGRFEKLPVVRFIQSIFPTTLSTDPIVEATKPFLFFLRQSTSGAYLAVKHIAFRQPGVVSLVTEISEATPFILAPDLAEMRKKYSTTGVVNPQPNTDFWEGLTDVPVALVPAPELKTVLPFVLARGVQVPNQKITWDPKNLPQRPISAVLDIAAVSQVYWGRPSAPSGPQLDIWGDASVCDWGGAVLVPNNWFDACFGTPILGTEGEPLPKSMHNYIQDWQFKWQVATRQNMLILSEATDSCHWDAPPSNGGGHPHHVVPPPQGSDPMGSSSVATVMTYVSIAAIIAVVGIGVYEAWLRWHAGRHLKNSQIRLHPPRTKAPSAPQHGSLPSVTSPTKS